MKWRDADLHWLLYTIAVGSLVVPALRRWVEEPVVIVALLDHPDDDEDDDVEEVLFDK